MTLPIGIDLGTSTSEICVFRNDEPVPIADPSSLARSPIVPSLVARNKRGELLVGEEARAWVDLPGHGVREAKRKMGTSDTFRMLDQDYRPEEVAALVLLKLKSIAEEALGQAVRDVVLSVPANFPDAARQATLNAGQAAGLNVVRLINEPTAAALAFGVRNLHVEEQGVVFDFGGGTLDITVLEMMGGILDVKASFGDTMLGGKDFDEAMIRLLLSRFEAEHKNATIPEKSRAALKGVAEKAKVALSTRRSFQAHLPFFASRGGEPVDLEADVTREEFERACAPLLDRARECLMQALAAKKVRPETVGRVLLVGGTTYIPCVRRLVAEVFRREPSAEVNPDLAVCMGAAVQAALAAGAMKPESSLILTDVCPFGLGIDVVAEVGGREMLVYEPLIRPNTTIPYSFKKTYHLLHVEQKQVNVHLFQDHKGTARLPTDATDTNIEATIKDIPPSRTGRPHELEVNFSYDINGIAQLDASLPATRQRVSLVYQPTPGRMGAEEARAVGARARAEWEKSPEAKRHGPLLARGKRLASESAGERKTSLERAVVALEAALASGNAAEADRAGDRLADLLFDMEIG